MIKTKFHWEHTNHWFEIGDLSLLDMGCGNNKHDKFIGIDKRKDIKDVDVIHDVENIPWPFKEESCSVILLNH